jgi:hypothetical protein
MAVEFRYATLNEYQRISDFLGQYWAQGHVYTRMRDLFDWTFRRPGLWDPETYSFTVAVDGGDLVGILGGIPFTLNRKGHFSKAVWIVNYVVRPDYRKGAMALQLLSSFRKPEFAAVVAFGINPITVPIYQVLRGKVLPEIPRHFLIMARQEERMVRLLKITQPYWPHERITDLISTFHNRKLRGSPSHAGNSLPANWDEKDWAELSTHTVGAARDADYLDWRYRDHPVFDYRFVTVPEGSRTGLAVWRLETIQRATDLGREDVDRIARLLEFLPASLENADQLFGAVLRDVEAAGAMAIDFYSYHSITRKWLKEVGFPGSDSHVDGDCLPSRFQPLDGKKGGIMSAIFLQDIHSSNFTADDCPWYWTKSDSDQDRPN